MKYFKNLIVVSMLIFCMPLHGQEDSPSVLTLDRIFSDEFATKSFGPVKWLDDGTYTVFEASEDRVRDVVRYDPETDERKVLIPAHRLIIPGTSSSVSSYSLSENRNRLMTSTTR